MPAKQYLLMISCLLITAMLSCKKGFLQQQPNTGFTVPNTLAEFQAILDNEQSFSESPAAIILSGEPLYFTDDYCAGLTNSDLNLYLWAKEVYGPEETVTDWSGQYALVFYANQVIEGLKQFTVTETNKALHNQLRGAALFLRAYSFYNLSQLYAPPYDSKDATTALGIPLHTNGKAGEPSVRSTLQATYEQIINDLQEAVRLLPETMDKVHPNRPAKPAAYAMLARVYLSMRFYEQAGAAADSCLRLYRELINYNNIDPADPVPFTADNPEVLYQSRIKEPNGIMLGLLTGSGSIDPALYHAYAPGDLRATLFFRTTPMGLLIKGSYYGDFSRFTGLATDEVYLIRAECAAWLGHTTAALADLNALLAKRWQPEYFMPRQSTDTATVLAWIRTEREKELVLRGLRWTDVRRLNKEGKKITLTRIVYGTTYELLPNDLRYTLPIPPEAIRRDPMQQNPR